MEATREEQNKTIGANIRKYRKEQRLTIKQLAAAVGLSVDGLTNYELGRRTTPTKTLVAIAAVLNVNPHRLDADIDSRRAYRKVQMDNDYIEACSVTTCINGTKITTIPVFGFNCYNLKVRRVLLKTIAATPDDTSNKHADFAVVVPDDSMAPSIAKHSLLLCEKPATEDYKLYIKQGAIVAAMINGHFAVRRVVLIDDKQTVLMADSDHQIITVNREAVIILGIGVGFRSSL